MTYTQVSTGVALKDGATTASWSQSIAVGNSNRAILDATIYAVQLGATDEWTLTLEQSNDMENWQALNGLTIATGDAPGYYAMDTADTISMDYLRIAYAMNTLSTGDFLVVTAGINLFRV